MSLLFAIFLVDWKTRNLKISENKEPEWISGWEQVKKLIAQWKAGKQRVVRGKQNVVQSSRDSLNKTKWTWWVCGAVALGEEAFWVGGYLEDKNNIMRCWMGNLVQTKSETQAYLMGVEEAVQFLLEEVNATEDEVTLN
ncbi:hypothetical protein PIB30_102494, partial [Stylosanthes scabra]|nr:hypothetical protein [Stylosanthes scabra]